MDPPDQTFESCQLDLTRVMSTLYLDLEQQIARADAKANLILAANSVLIAGAVNVAVSTMRDAEHLPQAWQLLAALVPAVLLSAVAVYYALVVAYPRHAPRFEAGVPGALFSSLSIAAQAPEQYFAQFLNAGTQDIKRNVLSSIHAKAAILQVKFRHVRFGIYATVGAFVGWLGFVVFIAWHA